MSKTPVKSFLDYCYNAADLDGKIETLYSGIMGGRNRHGYVYGGQGEKYTADLAARWAANGRSIPPGMRLLMTKKAYFTQKCAKWYGRVVEDCSGLIVNAVRVGVPRYKDSTANDFINSRCTKTGPISTIPETPGAVVWKSGHIGVYIGNGWVIEARGTDYGVVKSKLSTQKWKKWGLLSAVDYGKETTEKAWTVSRVLKYEEDKPMQSGADVRELQARLIDEGFKTVLIGGKLKAVDDDGTFGPITAAAVKAYQKSKGLDVDGKAGKNTITALGGKWRG